MSIIYLCLYVAVGFVAALITMLVFPPMEGFRPKLSLRVLAICVFTALWPVLVLLAAWYLGVGYMNRNKESVQDSSVSNIELVAAKPLSGFQGSKPR